MQETDRQTYGRDFMEPSTGDSIQNSRQRPDTEITRYLNAIEQIALDEGPDAITPDRIQGMRELFEEVMWEDPVLAQSTEPS